MTNAALRGKPDAGSPHVLLDEGEVASAATPRRGSLLYGCSRFLSAVCAAAACTALAARAAEAPSVKIAEGGRPLADIVISADAGAGVRFGAEDLKWHLKKITGGEFKVVTDDEPASGRYEIRIGESKRTKAKKADFKFQQYSVEVRADAAELVGWDDEPKVSAKRLPKIEDDEDGSLKLQNMPGLFGKHGSLYAVYQFLEDAIGVKWVDCTEYGTTFKVAPDLAIPLMSKRFEPFVEYRGGTIEYSFRADCWRSRTAEQLEFEKLAYVNPKKQRSYAWLYLLRHRAGGRYAQCNHSLYYFYDFYLKKNSRSFKEYHPEYFSKGGPEGSEPTQLCYTRQDVVDRVAADIASYFNSTNANKTTPMYNYRDAMGTRVKYWGDDNCALEPMDNGTMCQCENCSRLLALDRNGGGSTLWFSFVKRVADKLLVTNPGCSITTLAYGGHEALPVGVVLPKNVQVVFCLSGNRGGPRGKGFAAQMGRMRDWRAAYPGQPMGVWFYSGFPYEFYDNGRYQGVHGFYAHEAKKQYMALKELNARQGVFQCGLSGAVCQYVTFAFLLDPEADVEKLLGEYFAQFGAAARDLREFYDIVEDRYCNLSYRGKNAAGAEQCWRYVCPAEVMSRLGALIERAESRGLSDLERKRVALFKHANWTYMKTGFDNFNNRDTAPQPVWNSVRVPDAGGDLGKVAWNLAPELPLPCFDRGGDEPAKIDWTLGYRIANDSEWVYLELDQNRPSNITIDRSAPGVMISPGIACFDTWELVVAERRSMPYRYFLCGADGRMESWSNGEVNFRMNVKSEEHGLRDFGVRFESDISTGRKWRCRWAFPLAKMLEHPVKPGGAFILNPASVLHPGACVKQSPYGIVCPVSFSTVKTYDRGIEVRLAK